MGKDSRVTRVLIRRIGGCPDVKKESWDSRTSDHPTFGHRVMVKIGQWRKVMSVVFKIPSLQYLWAIWVVRSSSQLEIQTGALGRGEHMNEFLCC